MDDSTTSSSPSSTTASSFQSQPPLLQQLQQKPAEILTRSSLPSLSTLDAGDVIECYALFRHARLAPTDSAAAAAAGGTRRTVDDPTESSSSSWGGGGGSSSSSSSRGQDPGNNSLLRIGKSALAFRYRPPSWSNAHEDDGTSAQSKRSSYELTLEYGPRRTGSDLGKESLPVVVGSIDGARYPGDGLAHLGGDSALGGGGAGDAGGGRSRKRKQGNEEDLDRDDGESEGDDYDGGSQQRGPQEQLFPDERYVTWDNEARIYYRQHIEEEDWVGAYYIAPISGAVLSKVLDFAVEYAERHRRYQPFEVVAMEGARDGESRDDRNIGEVEIDKDSVEELDDKDAALPEPRPILRSSSSDDFVWAIFDALASMYVDIHPILAPPRQRVRFFVRSISDVKKLSGIVPAEDLELPGLPLDFDRGDSIDESTNGTGSMGDGRDNQEQGASTEQSNSYSFGSGRNIASLASDFYSKFYNCANAIRTGDYSQWEKSTEISTVAPTLSPTVISTADQTLKQRAFPVTQSPTATEIALSPSNDDVEDSDHDINNDDTDLPVDDDDDGEINDNEDSWRQDDRGSDDEERGNDNDDMFEFDVGPPLRLLKKNGYYKHKKKLTGSASSPPLSSSGPTSASLVQAPGLSELKSQEVMALNKENDKEFASGDDNNGVDNDVGGSESDTVITAEGNNPLSSDISEDDNGEGDAAEEAVEAAQKALDAANNAAAISPSDEAAATAAKEAADAAKKAAQASSHAKASAAMDALLSVDGSQMMQALGTCWSDPKYGIRVDRKVALPPSDRKEEGGVTGVGGAKEQRYATLSTTYVYLYLDGTSYYRLNLTSPFWDVSQPLQPMPQPKLFEEGRAQFLDNVFFFGIIGGFIFGMIVLLHVVGILRFDSRLKFRKFFHPTHPGPMGSSRRGYLNASQLRRDSGVFTDEDASLNEIDSFDTDEAEERWEQESAQARQRGGGQAHPFNNPSAIPAVFVGKSSPPVQKSRRSSDDGDMGLNGHGGSEWEGDFELAEMNGVGNGGLCVESVSRQSCRSDEGLLGFEQAGKAAVYDGDYKTPPSRGRSSSRSEGSDSNLEKSSNKRRRSPTDSVPLPAQMRMARDPDLVDFPGLKSSTPVALPVGMSRQASSQGDSIENENNVDDYLV